jgi:hypothetical protein
MVVIPQLRPALLKLLETNFGTTIATAIWKRLVDHVNFVNHHMPVGMVIMVQQGASFGSISWPLPTISSCWQFCDGSPVTNPDSPLYGQNVPDLTGRFLKHGTTIGTLGGAETINLQHAHSGWTGVTLDAEFSNPRTDDDNERKGFNNHRHGLSNSLSTVSKVPIYGELQPYMRIV